MFRIIGYLLLMALVLLVLSGIFGYLSYGLSPNLGGTAKVQHLSAQTIVNWDDTGISTIQAQNEYDAFTGLGYAHAAQNGWHMMLLRQTATGSLAQWYNEPLRKIDAFVHQLDIPQQAQKAYFQLSIEDKKAVDAYTNGINAIFEKSKSNIPDEMLLSGQPVEKWEPWHTLAVERLLAWVGTPALSMPDSLSNPQKQILNTFITQDKSLRKWLYLHGFENGMAWTAKQGNEQFFFQRHVTGSSALSLFQEVQFNINGKISHLLTLPATLNFPTGKNEGMAWHVFLTAPLQLSTAAFADSTFSKRFSVMKDKNENETLITNWYKGNQLALRVPMAKGDSLEKPAFLINWNGFAAKSDVRIFRRFLNGFTPDSNAFSLLKGNGLLVSRSGGTRVLGTPKVQEILPNGVLVSDSRWGKETAKVLLKLNHQSLKYALKTKSAHSAWATERAKMIVALDTLKTKPKDLWQPLKYLRNWDYRYDQAAIGAGIFDHWMASYSRYQAQLPDSLRNLVATDSLSRIRVLLGYTQSLAEAVTIMKNQPKLGNDFRNWRWENAQPLYAYYPVWSSNLSGLEGSNLHKNRYAPLKFSGIGHPSTLFWRPSWTETLPSPMAWEGWVGSGNWNVWQLTRPQLHFKGFIGRYRVLNPLKDLAWGENNTVVSSQTILESK